MAIIHDAYQFNCGAFAKNVRAHLNQAQGRPTTAYHLLRTTGKQIVHDNKWVRGLLDSYGGWDETAIDRELPQTWAGDPADLSFWLSTLLYEQLKALGPASLHGLYSLWRTLDETLHRAGWDSADRSLLIRGHDFGVLFDRYVKSGEHDDLAIPGARSFFELIRPASASGSAGWFESSEVVLFQHRLIAEKDHLESKTTNANEREAIQRAIDMLSAAAAQQTALCFIKSG